MLFVRNAFPVVLTRHSIARMLSLFAASIDVPTGDGILDEIQLDAVDDDALDAAGEGTMTSGGFGDAAKVVGAADEKRLVKS